MPGMIEKQFHILRGVNKKGAEKPIGVGLVPRRMLPERMNIECHSNHTLARS